MIGPTPALDDLAGERERRALAAHNARRGVVYITVAVVVFAAALAACLIALQSGTL